MTPYFGRNLSRQWNLIDTVTLASGHHNLKFGLDYRHIKAPIVPPNVEPYAEFTSTGTMLAGAPEITEFINYKPATPLIDETALFIQDEWHLNHRLNLSLGLRWEVNPPPTEQHGDNAYTLLGNINDPASLSLPLKVLRYGKLHGTTLLRDSALHGSLITSQIQKRLFGVARVFSSTPRTKLPLWGTAVLVQCVSNRLGSNHPLYGE